MANPVKKLLTNFGIFQDHGKINCWLASWTSAGMVQYKYTPVKFLTHFTRFQLMDIKSHIGSGFVMLTGSVCMFVDLLYFVLEVIPSTLHLIAVWPLSKQNHRENE